MDFPLIMLPSDPEFADWLSIPPPGMLDSARFKTEPIILAVNPESQVIEEVSVSVVDGRIEDLGIYY